MTASLAHLSISTSSSSSSTLLPLKGNGPSGVITSSALPNHQYPHELFNCRPRHSECKSQRHSQRPNARHCQRQRQSQSRSQIGSSILQCGEVTALRPSFRHSNNRPESILDQSQRESDKQSQRHRPSFRASASLLPFAAPVPDAPPESIRVEHLFYYPSQQQQTADAVSHISNLNELTAAPSVLIGRKNDVREHALLESQSHGGARLYKLDLQNQSIIDELRASEMLEAIGNAELQIRREVILPHTDDLMRSSPSPNTSAAIPHLPWHPSATSAPVADVAALPEAAPSQVSKFPFPPGEAPILDAARVLTSAKTEMIRADISSLERTTGWRLRVLTRYSPGVFDADEIRSYWKPDEKTVIVILDVTAPNIFNFNTGDQVRVKLPRQFFIELQSRFGNQFYVREEGEQEALMETVGTLVTCLSSPDGCLRVPGLSDDLFFLTLGTSIAGGAVFGFSLRQEPTGQVTATWQWALIFSPLWLILFVALGVSPVASRTSDVEPLIKDTAGFLAAAAAVYLTPILGVSPASRWFEKKD